jgi:integrase
MTRYPKNGKGSKWTVAELKAIPPEWEGDTVSDGGGLSGEVRKSSKGAVSIRFKYAFRLDNKTAWFSCGTFPIMDIAVIRAARDNARKLVSQGIDPRTKKVADKIEAQAAIDKLIAEEEKKQTKNLTVHNLFDIWVRDGVSRADGNKYIVQSFNKHVLPKIGEIPLRDLSENHLRDIYRNIVLNGHQARAVEISKDVKQMLRWAEQRKPWRGLLVDGNPSNLVDVSLLLSNDYTKERSRVLDVDEIRKLNHVFEDAKRNYDEAPQKYGVERPLKREVQIAMWICLSTMCRIGELLMTEWKHVNFDDRTWFIPKANTKGARGKKNDQLVYLSDFSLKFFKELFELTSDSQWAFPARYKDGHVCVKSASKQIGDRQVKFKQRNKKLQYRVENNSLVLGEEEWTPHDLRRTGATMMQKLKIPRDVINLCQNHVIGSKVDRHYLLHDYADEKREAWYKLGDKLDEILGISNVFYLKSA